MQQRVKSFGALAAALTAGLAIVMLAKAFQSGAAAAGDTRAILAAPQASIMKALVGGVLAHLVGRKSDRTGGARGRTMRERGVVIASGFMAGGTLGGVLGAALRLVPWYAEDRIQTPFYAHEAISQIVSIVLFASLCAYLWIESTRRVGTDEN